jgi:hypothetical protein
MDHTFPVTVVDDTGAGIAAAVVCVVEKSAVGVERHPFPSLAATHGDSGGGKYAETSAITPTEGDWLLVVSLKGKSPVVQPFKLKKGKDGEFTASPTPAAVATVTISGTLRKVGSNKVKEIAFHVTLFPAAEIVFIGGVDYNIRDVSGGWQFADYGFNRAEVLRRKKKIDNGTIVTVFSTSKIWRKKQVFGVKKWVVIEVVQLGDFATRTSPAPGDLYKPVAGLDIHITDFYKYLAEVGSREPNSVLEIGIFSHSFPFGPILYDTPENAANRGLLAARDPDDFDARPKDFNPTNFAGYPKMKDALAATCRFTIWGCSATTHLKFASRMSFRAIQNKRPEDEFFIVRNEIENHDGNVVRIEEERTSELRHRFNMDRSFRGGTYAAEAAKKLDIEVRAGCPGTGSDPSTVDGIEMLTVDLATYKDVFDYFHAKFAPEFAETNEKWDKGYVDYHALQSRAAVAAPPFSTQSYFLEIDKLPTRFNPGAGIATLTFGNRIKIDHPTADVQVVSKVQADLVTAGKTGHLYVLKDNDPAKSQAAYVQEDQRVFRITQNAAKEWKVIGPEIH